MAESAAELRKNANIIFVREIEPRVRGLDKERKELLLEMTLFWIAFVLVYIAALWFAFKLQSDGFFAMTFLSLPLLAQMYHVGKVKEFENKIKRLVFPFVLQKLNDFKWADAYEGVDKNQLRYSGLFYGLFKNSKDISVELDDVFSGVYKDVDIQINDLTIEHEKSSVYFRGVVLKLDTKRSYTGTTLILQNKFHRKSFLRNLIAPVQDGLDTVILEDADFMKEYSVYSSDQVEARYILTPSFIERIKQISFAFDAKTIDISIVNNQIWIAVKTNKDMFKLGRLTKAVFDLEGYKKAVNEVASILELIDELKLDVNIGL